MGTYIGIDLGGTSVKGGRIGLNGIECREIFLVSPQGSPDEIFKEICLLINNLWTEDVGGIGFAVPALIDFKLGIMYGMSNITQLNDFPIRMSLEKRFNVPVLLQNDANCFVLGEKYFGEAYGFQNIVGLITGTGVGAGIIVNGQLYSGTNCGAGEFGMIPYKDKCFESYCSGQFFSEVYSLSGEEMAQKAIKGDQEALAAFDSYGKNLGELIKLICYALDPQLVIVGGSVSISFQFYEEAMYKSLEDYFFTPDTKVKITPSIMEDVAIYGAGSLFYQ